MRIFHRIPTWLCSALCLVWTPLNVVSATIPSFTITIQNGFSTNVNVTMFTASASCAATYSNYGEQPNRAPGATVQYGPYNNAIDTTYYIKVVANNPGNGALILSCCLGLAQSVNGSTYIIGPICGGGGPTTNYVAPRAGCWTNLNPNRWAGPTFAFRDGAGNLYYPPGAEGGAIRPGGIWCWTNGQFTFIPPDGVSITAAVAFDIRDDNPPNLTSYGVTNWSSTGPGGGGGSGTVTGGTVMGNTNIFHNPTTAGTTNGASQQDIYRLGDVFSVSAADQLATLRGMSNIMRGAFGGVTNGTGGGGTGTNVNVMNWPTNYRNASVEGSLSNLFGYVSNLVAAGSNVTRGYLMGLTNAFLGAADFVSTNLIGTNFLGYEEIAGGLDQQGSALAGAIAGNTPDPEWGIITLMTATGTTNWDLKTVFSCVFADYYLPGFRSWLRCLLVWGLLIGMLGLYFYDMRNALWELLVIGQVQIDSQAAGGASLIPGVNVTMRMLVCFAIMLAILFVPSIITAAVSTTLTILAYGTPAAAVVSTGTAIANPPQTILNIFSCWSATLPIWEATVFAFNYLVARFFMEGMLMWAMPLIKVIGV